MKLRYPLNGIGQKPGIFLTQVFGVNPQNYPSMKGHNGLDWGAPKGTPVLACRDGRLITKPLDPDGYGIYVRVQWEEDGYTWDSVYGHFEKIEGIDRDVKEGDVIGYVDSTGYSTGHHLHFGLRKKLNGAVVDYSNGYLGYIDPMPYMKIYIRKVKIEGTKEIGFYIPADTPDRLDKLFQDIKELRDYQVFSEDFTIKKTWT